MGMFDFLSKKPLNQNNRGVKVKEIMTQNPIVVSGTTTIAQIEEIFSNNKIWSIYVGDPDNYYIGIITRDDLKFRAEKKKRSAPAYSIMSKGVISIDENAAVEDAKTLIYNKKINGLAVTRNGKHCGIITRYDIENKKPKVIPPPEPPIGDWTNNDIQLLKQSWGEGKFVQIIANLLKRRPDAVVHKLIETGLIGYNDDNCYPKPAQSGLTWSDRERTELISELNAGKTIPEIANIHRRNMNAIFHMMVTLKTFNYMDRSLLEEYIGGKGVPPDPNQLIRTLISELENNNNNIDVRNSAATQLGSFHEPSVVNALIKCVKNDQDIRYRALVSLRKIGDRLAIPVFIECSEDYSAKIRLVSVIALGEIGEIKDSTVIEHLESLIKSKDYQSTYKNGGNPEIIQAARDALQKIRSREPQPPPDKQERDDRRTLIQRIKETESFGVLPSPIKDSVQQPDALRYPDEVIALLSQLDEFLTTARPQINLHLSCKQIAVVTWKKENISITNEGSAHAKDITFEFSDDVDVRRIKKVDVLAGETKQVEMYIKAKVKGTIPLDVIVTYSDKRDKLYTDTFDFDIEVIDNGSIEPEKYLIEKYTELESIGKGGFAQVFKAKRKDGKYVAVKIPISLDESTEKAFIAELQNWAPLNHPNIVKVYNFFIMPRVYFEMELCDSSLADQKKPIDSNEAAQIIFDVCEGLKFTHSKKIIHQDLKPHNILLKSGVPKISDWGLSRVITESKSTTATSFTLYYAAPEQISGEHKDERTDIWQLGVILYELVTGLLPFSGDLAVVVDSIKSKDPQSPSAINPSLHDIDAMIMKCLEKNPNKRYQSVHELQKDLALFLRVTYTESFKKSKTTNNPSVIAFYCGRAVMMSLLAGDMESAYVDLLALVHYSKGDVKKQVKELSEHLKILIDNGNYEIDDTLILKVKVIVQQVNLEFKDMG